MVEMGLWRKSAPPVSPVHTGAGAGATKFWLLTCILVPIVVLAGAGMRLAFPDPTLPNTPLRPEKITIHSGPREFSETEPVQMMIPSIGLQADVGFAPLVKGRLDSRAMRKGPVLIDPEAGPGLVPVGPSGVSLILGHRQWGPRPLIFARLDELSAGDSVLLSGAAQTLVYHVFDIREIAPALVWDTVELESEKARHSGRSVLILITCAPYGYNWRRLLVLAERPSR